MGAVKTLCYPIWFQSPEKCYPIWVHITHWAFFEGFVCFVPLFLIKQGYKTQKLLKKRPPGKKKGRETEVFLLQRGTNSEKQARNALRLTRPEGVRRNV